MDTGPLGAPHRDPPHGVEVGPVLARRATWLRVLQGAAATVAMIGLVVTALWLAGVDMMPGPARTGSAGPPGVQAGVSPTAAPTESAAETPSSAGHVLVVPGVPCNTRTPPPSLGMTLIIGGGPSFTRSTASGVPPPAVTVAPDAGLLLVLGAEDCAVAWDVVVTADGVEAPVFEEVLTNPSLSLAYGMQNRWEVSPLPPGDYRLSAHLVTLSGESVLAGWRLHVGGAPASAATAVP
jgi:hypothetical protein